MQYGDWQGTDWDTINELVSKHTHSTDRLGLWGPPGVGKSFIFLNGQPHEPVTIACNEGMLASDFYGAKMPEADGKGGTSMVWQDGPALVAAKEDRPILLNEVDKASDDVKEVLYALADDPESRRLTWTNGTAQAITPGSNYRVFATSNVNPERLQEALKDRFLWLYVDEPHPDALALLPEHMREACRVLAGHPDPAIRTSLRTFRRFADLLENHTGTDSDGYERAARLAFGTRWEQFADADRLTDMLVKAQNVREDGRR